jgi:hypothetical protein
MRRLLFEDGLEPGTDYMTLGEAGLQDALETRMAAFLLGLSTAEVVWGLAVTANSNQQSVDVAPGVGLSPAGKLILVEDEPTLGRPARVGVPTVGVTGDRWVSIRHADLDVRDGFFHPLYAPYANKRYDSYEISLQATGSPGAEYAVLAKVVISGGVVVSVSDLRDAYTVADSTTPTLTRTKRTISIEEFIQPVWHRNNYRVGFYPYHWNPLTGSGRTRVGRHQGCDEDRLCVYAKSLRYHYLGGVGWGRDPVTGTYLYEVVDGVTDKTPIVQGETGLELFRVRYVGAEPVATLVINPPQVSGQTSASPGTLVVTTGADPGEEVVLLNLNLHDVSTYTTLADLVTAIDAHADLEAEFHTAATVDASKLPLEVLWMIPTDLSGGDWQIIRSNPKRTIYTDIRSVYYSPYGGVTNPVTYALRNFRGVGMIVPRYFEIPLGPTMGPTFAPKPKSSPPATDGPYVVLGYLGKYRGQGNRDVTPDGSGERSGEMVATISLPDDLHVPAGDGTHCRFYVALRSGSSGVGGPGEARLVARTHKSDGSVVETINDFAVTDDEVWHDFYVEVPEPEPGDLVTLHMIETLALKPSAGSDYLIHARAFWLDYYRDNPPGMFVGG